MQVPAGAAHSCSACSRIMASRAAVQARRRTSPRVLIESRPGRAGGMMPARIAAGMVSVSRPISPPTGPAALRPRCTRVTAIACPAGPVTITLHSQPGSAAAVLASIRAVDGVTGPSQHRLPGWPDRPARVRQGTVTVSSRARGSLRGDPRFPVDLPVLAGWPGQFGAQPGAGTSPGSGKFAQLGLGGRSGPAGQPRP